jgi:glyoxylate reductase
MSLPRIIADTPLAEDIDQLLEGKVEILPWDTPAGEEDDSIEGIYTYGHVAVDDPLMERFPGIKVISNYGVGVDHIDLDAARSRELPVGNTPDVLNGATADMPMALLLAASRRIIEGNTFARSPEFTYYDPGYMLGREGHSSTMGIIGLGRIGLQIACRARGFDMTVLYHNRNERTDLPEDLGATYVSMDELLERSDYVILSCPLTAETEKLIGERELELMKSTATLVNVARGGVVDTDALTAAIEQGSIYHAGLDVTDPEPLLRDHPMLLLDNVTIAPHLDSATEQTRQQMAEISVENLLSVGVRSARVFVWRQASLAGDAEARATTQKSIRAYVAIELFAFVVRCLFCSPCLLHIIPVSRLQIDRFIGGREMH